MKQKVLDQVRKHWAAVGLDPSLYSFEYVEGRGKFDKIVATYTPQGSKATSAAAFYEKATGALYRAGSWSAPAKTRIA